MVVLDLAKNWTMPVRDWVTIYAQLAILFEHRLQ
jgi:transposase-like protein